MYMFQVSTVSSKQTKPFEVLYVAYAETDTRM